MILRIAAIQDRLEDIERQDFRRVSVHWIKLWNFRGKIQMTGDQITGLLYGVAKLNFVQMIEVT